MGGEIFKVCLSNWAVITSIFLWCTTVKVAHSSLLIVDLFILADVPENESDL